MSRFISKLVAPGMLSEFSRRELLRTGMSMTTYLSLAPFLLGRKGLSQESFTAQRKLVWVHLDGGWDILEATDPKPQSTPGIDMVYDWSAAQDLAGSNGVKIGRWMPQVAQRGEDVVVVRGLAMGTTSHDAGPVYFDTGVLSNSGRVNAASIPSIVASESQATIPIIQLDGGMLPMVDRGLLNPVSSVRAQKLELYREMYPSDSTEKDQQLALLDYLKESITRVQDEVGSHDRLTSLAAAEDKIRTQIVQDVGQQLTVTSSDSSPFEAREGNRTASRWALALKLVKNDLTTCVNMGIGGFDTHSNQTVNMQPIMEELDFNLAVFMDELRTAGKLDETLIVLYSDFGRTPKVNGGNGRDHWPTGGAIIAGGGLLGGRAVGGTDDNLNAESIDASSGDISSSGTQINPTHVGGSILELTLGSNYLPYRSYLESIAALTQLKGDS